MCDVKMTGGNVALMEAVRGAGPIAIGINANNLQFYESGVINAASCPPRVAASEHINHAALLVGWGEENGVKYWLVKNSYGLDFGENGYFRLERAAPSPDTLFGTCGMLFESVYPVVTRAGDKADEETLRSQCTEGFGVQAGLLPQRGGQPGRRGVRYGRSRGGALGVAGQDERAGAAVGAAPWQVSVARGVDARWEGARAFATGASLVVVAAAGVALVGARIAGGRRERERDDPRSSGKRGAPVGSRS